MTDPSPDAAPKPEYTLGRIQYDLVEAREIADLSGPLGDIGATLMWLRIMVEHGLKESVYREIFTQTPAKLSDLPRVATLLADDALPLPGEEEKITARGATGEQLRAVQAAIHALDSAAWAIRAASDVLKNER